MEILNYGSLNIDLVYRVEHVVRPGETVAGKEFLTFAGGKGLNQSTAMARAGAAVRHAGKVGADGRWLIDKLRAEGVDTTGIRVGKEKTGHAVIQVDDRGENAIFLYGGANRAITAEEITETLDRARAGDLLVLQNEISNVSLLIRAGAERGLRVCFNPAPMTDEVQAMPLERVEYLILNRTEAAGLAGAQDDAGGEELLAALGVKLPACNLVLTLGAEGVLARPAGGRCKPLRALPPPVDAVDTTAAGDTFIGYFLAAVARGDELASALDLGCRAAAVAVTRPGAMDSIPYLQEV